MEIRESVIFIVLGLILIAISFPEAMSLGACVGHKAIITAFFGILVAYTGLWKYVVERKEVGRDESSEI